MTLLSLTLAPLLAIQGAGTTLVAIKNDDPETWFVEYPRLIQPYVREYRRCLNVTNRMVTGKADFEEQHRSDIPRCTKEREAAIAASNAELEGAKTSLSPAQVTELFDNIGKIHVLRGADLDKQFTQTLTRVNTARDQYDAERPKGLVIELLDASVVKERAEVAGSKETKE